VVVLFLHGAGLSKAMWRPQLDTLAGELEVEAIDLPGHGERMGERFTFPAAVEAVAETVAGRPAVLVGLSLGGYVALQTVAERRDLAGGLVLTGCSVDYSRLGNRFVAWTAEVFQRVWPKRMLRNAQTSAFARQYPDWAAELEAGGFSWRGYADALRAARRIRWHEVAAGYDRPVLILNGENDKPHVREQPKLLECFPRGTAELVPGAGHLANLDRPEAYTDAVRRLVAGVAAA
jgi:pimeloyl-ACP methyl ester carboxylesterase